MMKHLTAADYRKMPWANGKGTTVEMIRFDGPEGMLWRLSMASVVEDGAFSIFPDIERNLTVISGPGFVLEGQGAPLNCTPLSPVAFAGDEPIRATGVTAPSEDFNVMTARSIPRPKVQVISGGEVSPLPGEILCLLALEPGAVGGIGLAKHDMMLTDQPVTLQTPAITVILRP